MKAELNNENSVFNEFELKLYGVQAYGVTYGEEYNVIVKAARRANGRYYFITREGYEIAWSTLPADQVEHICADMYDQHDRDELATIKHVNQLRNDGTALVPAEIMNDVADTAEAVGVRCFILTSGIDEAGRVKYLCSIGTTAEEGRELATAAKLNREAIAAENENTTTDETPAAPAADIPAEMTAAEVEKIARAIMDDAADITAEITGGRYVYHVAGYNFGENTAQNICFYLEDRELVAADALEMGGPSDYFENERTTARAGLDRFHAADVAARESNESAAPAADQKTTNEYIKKIINEAETRRAEYLTKKAAADQFAALPWWKKAFKTRPDVPRLNILRTAIVKRCFNECIEIRVYYTENRRDVLIAINEAGNGFKIDARTGEKSPLIGAKGQTISNENAAYIETLRRQLADILN